MRFLARWLGLEVGVVALASARMFDGVASAFVIIALTRTVDEVSTPLFDLPTNTRLGLLISVFGLVFSLVQPVAGRIFDRLPNLKPVIIGGIGGFTILTALLSQATTYWQVILLRCLQGVTLACTIPTSLNLIGMMTQSKRRGKAMGVFGTARMAGFGVGPLIAGALLLTIPTAQSYLLAAVPGLVAVLLVVFFLPNAAGEQASPVSDPPQDEAQRAQTTQRYRFSFIIIGSVFFVAACCMTSLLSLEEEFTVRLGLNSFDFSMAFSAMIGVRLLLDFGMGRLSDRTGRKVLIIIGLMLLGPATLLLGYAQSANQLIIVRLLMGGGMSAIAPPAFALTADLVEGKRAGAKVGIVTAGFGLGIAIGPLATALMADAFFFSSPFWLYAFLCIFCAILLAYSVQEPNRPPTEVTDPQPASEPLDNQ